MTEETTAMVSLIDKTHNSTTADDKLLFCPSIKKGVPKINIDFMNLSYSVRSEDKFLSIKRILQEISGSFKSGEVTAIMGSSGAGKSTLLDILSGYVTVGVTGSIRVNGHPSEMNVFRKLSSYIMQDDYLQPFLTLEEYLNVSAMLKLGTSVTKQQKSDVVNYIIETLGLEKHRHTRTEKLSGGQKKRVSIALELVNNPPVIFLDEPTTGLDTVASTQVVELLQKLAQQGRTVICTVHTPTALLCEKFDHMYVMTRGYCVYQGTFKNIVPFLSSVGYECPKSYNPSDYIIEVVHGKSSEFVENISENIQNGKLSVNENPVGETVKICRTQELSTPFIQKKNIKFPLSYAQQCKVLIKRKMLQQSRNTVTLWMMIFHHLLTGTFLGLIFKGVGQDASRPYENFKFLISVTVFFMYTYVVGPALFFPLEIKHVRREYFNNWYSLKAYFTTLIITLLPGQVLYSSLFVLTSYVIADQPLDLERMLVFTGSGILLAIISEGWGLAIGTLFSTRGASVVGPTTTVPLLAVSVYGMGNGGNIDPTSKFLMSISFVRHGVEILTNTVYGFNRVLHCDTEKHIYCHYLSTEKLLKDLGISGTITDQLIFLLFFLILHWTALYAALRYKLSTEFLNSLWNLMYKILKRKKLN